MNQTDLPNLLEKYKRGECTPYEKEILHKWLDDVSESNLQHDVFKSTGEELLVHDEVWSRIQQALLVTQAKKSYSIRWPEVWRYAAALIVICTSFYILRQAENEEAMPVQPLITWDTIYVQPRQIKKVILPDHSILYMNAGTTLAYPSDFGKTSRTVKILQGEVIFDVAHDPARPFIVEAQQTRTRVLGTRFSVSAYHDYPEVTVVVDRGKVSVGTDSLTLGVLQPTEALRYNITTQHVSTFKSDGLPFQPEHGSVLLRNCSFDEFAVRVKHTYGYTVATDVARIEDYSFTGELKFSEPVELMMKKFCAIHNIQYTINGKEIMMN